jgi:multidrug resistance efflux pump
MGSVTVSWEFLLALLPLALAFVGWLIRLRMDLEAARTEIRELRAKVEELRAQAERRDDILEQVAVNLGRIDERLKSLLERG